MGSVYKQGQMRQICSSKSSVCCFDEILIKILLFDEIEFCICTLMKTLSIKTINFRTFHSFENKMAEASELASLLLLNELLDSDDEKPTRGPTRDWGNEGEKKDISTTLSRS